MAYGARALAKTRRSGTGRTSQRYAGKASHIKGAMLSANGYRKPTSPRTMALATRPGHNARQAPAVNRSNEKNAVVPSWLNWVYILTWGTLAATNPEAMTAPQRPRKRPPRTAVRSIEATATADQNPYRHPARNSHGSGDGPDSHRPILSRTT